MTLPATFWQKTSRTDCVLWIGAQNSKGYGCYAVNGVTHLAHRLAWEDARGPIPNGLTVDHLCRVRACVNVAHLELVSIAENIRRAKRRLEVGGACRHGHEISSASDLYSRANGTFECRWCRTAARHLSRDSAMSGASRA